MKWLNKSDFVFQNNIPNVMSPVATFTCPLSQFYKLIGGQPFNLAITAYEHTTVATPSATFTFTTTYEPQAPYDENGNPINEISAIAYDITLNNVPAVAATGISGNVITFPGITGAGANDDIGVWYRIAKGSWVLYVQAGTSEKTSYMIMEGAFRTLNAIDQWNSKTLITLPADYPIAPADQLVLAVNTPATISMDTTSVATGFSYDLNVASFLRFPVEITEQPS